MNKRWVVVLAFCGVFVAGAVVGGLVVRRSAPPPAQPAQQHRGPPPSAPDLDRFASAIMRRYTARLELDEAQREKLQVIVHHAEGELRALRNRSFQETITIGDRMNDQVEGLLRADQHERFEKLKEAVQNYWERERERRNGNASAQQRSEAERKSEKSEKRDDEKREEPRKSEKDKSEKQEKSGKSDKSEKQQKRDDPRKPEKEKR